MRKQAKFLIPTAALLMFAGAFAMPANAGVEDYTLRKAIPGDVYMVVHGRQHDGMDFVNKQYERVWGAVLKARLDRDIKRFMRAVVRESGEISTEEFETQWQTMADLATAVDWSSLSKREFAMCMKMGFPTNEFVMMMIPKSGETDSAFSGLSGVAQSLVGMTQGALTLNTEEDGSTIIHRITAPTAPMPLGIMLAKHSDVILMGFGTALPTQVLEMLRGASDAAPLHESARFRAALKEVPPGKDALVFLDFDRMFTQTRQMLGVAMSSMPQPSPDSADYETMQKVKKLPNVLFDAMDMFEFLVSTTETDGMKARTHSVMRLKDDAQNARLYKAFFGNQSFSQPLKFVPAESMTFSVSSGVNIPELYKAVIEFIRDHVPDGDQAVAEIASLREMTGYDLEKDIIGWMGGRIVSVNKPGPTKFSPGEWTLMISVSDEPKATEMIGKMMELAPAALAQMQGSVEPADVDGSENFKSIIIPQLAMMGVGKPTLGVKDGWLVLGSSPEMINGVLATIRGEEPNVSASERFQKEGLSPTGDVVGISFTDQSQLGDQLSQALQAVGMLNLMPQVQQSRPLMAAIGIVGKLGTVVKQLNFFQSTASRTVREGNLIKTEMIQNYRDPEAPATSMNTP